MRLNIVGIESVRRTELDLALKSVSQQSGMLFDTKEADDSPFLVEGYCGTLCNRERLSEVIKGSACPDSGLVVFDAHTNCQEGGYLREMIESAVLDPKKILLFGTRSESAREKAYLLHKKIRKYDSLGILEVGLLSSVLGSMEQARTFGGISLVIDIDVLDPVFAPGEEAPSHGGLSSRELFLAISKFRLIKDIKGFVITSSFADKNACAIAARLTAELYR